MKRAPDLCLIREARDIRRGAQRLPALDLSEISVVELAGQVDGVPAQQQAQGVGVVDMGGGSFGGYESVVVWPAACDLLAAPRRPVSTKIVSPERLTSRPHQVTRFSQVLVRSQEPKGPQPGGRSAIDSSTVMPLCYIRSARLPNLLPPSGRKTARLIIGSSSPTRG